MLLLLREILIIAVVLRVLQKVVVR
jgi:hypothetical protein